MLSLSLVAYKSPLISLSVKSREKASERKLAVIVIIIIIVTSTVVLWWSVMVICFLSQHVHMLSLMFC